MAEGEEADLERFAEALRIRNALIDVTENQNRSFEGLEGIDGFTRPSRR